MEEGESLSPLLSPVLLLSIVDLSFFSIAVNTPAGFYAGSIVASLNPALTIAARSMVS